MEKFLGMMTQILGLDQKNIKIIEIRKVMTNFLPASDTPLSSTDKNFASMDDNFAGRDKNFASK
jgi:hypothetical protein